MKKNKLLLLVLCITLVFSLFAAGCSSDSDKDDTSANETVKFTDDTGREVELPAKIDSVIATGDMAQIYVYAIAPETLKAVSGAWSKDAEKYIDKKYMELPQVGSFFGNHDLNYEEIASLGAQVIIDVGEAKPTIKEDLDDITEKTGVPAVHIDSDLMSADKAFGRLGELLGKEDQAKEISSLVSEIYTKVNDSIDKVKDKKKVLYCLGEDGLNVLAKGSYHSQIVDMLSDNVAVLDDPSSMGTGNEVNMEQIMNWDPEIILFAPESYYKDAAGDSTWKTLGAIKNNNYYEIPCGPYNWMGYPPSCNMIMGLAWMAKLLYPEQADYDLKEVTKDYYKLFYHYDLTDDDYNSLVKESLGKQ